MESAGAERGRHDAGHGQQRKREVLGCQDRPTPDNWRAQIPEGRPGVFAEWKIPGGPATGVYYHAIELWDVDKAEILRVFNALYSDGPDYRPSGPRFFSGQQVCLQYEAAGRRAQRNHDDCFLGSVQRQRWHVGVINPACQALAWSPDGQRLAGNTGLGQYMESKIWDLGKLQLSDYHIGHRGLRVRYGPALAWSREGKLLARIGAGHQIELWNPTAPKQVRSLRGIEKNGKFPVGPYLTLTQLVFSPQSDLLATLAPQDPWLWDAASGQPVRRLDSLGKPLGAFADAAWSPDGKTLATANHNWNGVDLWDIDTGMHRQQLEGHKGRVRALAWSPDGKILATGGADQSVRLWKQTGEFLTQLTDPDGNQKIVNALAWLPDGKTLVTLSDNRTLCVWDTSNDKLVRVNKELDGQGRFSPDGKLLASLNTLAGIRLWDTATGQPARASSSSSGPNRPIKPWSSRRRAIISATRRASSSRRLSTWSRPPRARTHCRLRILPTNTGGRTTRTG